MEGAAPPRESIYDPAERFPAVGADFQVPYLDLPSLPETGIVGGDRIREAILEVRGLYLRWESPELKEAFLRSEVHLPGGMQVAATEERPAGVPLPLVLGMLPRFGFRAQVRPPMIRILRFDGPGSDRPRPR